MKNRYFNVKQIILLMAILVIFMALTFVACGNETSGGSEGYITITNIPSEYIGKYIMFWATGGEGGSNTSYGVEVFHGPNNYTLTEIRNNKVSIPVWLRTQNGIEKYTRDFTYITDVGKINSPGLIDYGLIRAYIYEEQNINLNGTLIAGVYFYSVTFKKGIATISWESRIKEYDIIR